MPRYRFNRASPGPSIMESNAASGVFVITAILCVCVCVCDKGRSEGERDGWREGGREGGRKVD